MEKGVSYECISQLRGDCHQVLPIQGSRLIMVSLLRMILLLKG